MARLWKSGKNGTGKNGQFVPLFSDFTPISDQFHTFLLHSPQCIFGNLLQFPIIPNFPPSPPPFFAISPHFHPLSPIFPFSPFSFTSAASWLIRLRLTPMPGMHTAQAAQQDASHPHDLQAGQPQKQPRTHSSGLDLPVKWGHVDCEDVPALRTTLGRGNSIWQSSVGKLSGFAI